MLRAAIELCISNNFKKANKKFKLVEREKFKSAAAYCNRQFVDGWMLIMLKPDNSPGEIAHEALHATNAIMDRMGQEPDLDNDEFQAYLLTYIVDECYGNIKRYKKKLKKQR